MYHTRLLFDKDNIISALYIIIFCLFVSPYSISIDNQGVSANYLFVFFPILVVFFKGVFAWPTKSVMLYIILLCLIFLLGAVSNIDQFYLFVRQTASFLVFMSIFTFMFLKLDRNMIRSFKFSLILYSLILSLISIFEFYSIDGNNAGFYAKGLLGSQRIGFIYLLGFWLSITFKVDNPLKKIAKFLISFIILSGLMLTFTRTSIFGLAVSIFAYFIYTIINDRKNHKSIKKSLANIFTKITYLFLMFTCLLIFFKGPTQFYSNSIFKYIFSNQSDFMQDDELMLNTSFNSYEQFQLIDNKQINLMNSVSVEGDYFDNILIEVDQSNELNIINTELKREQQYLSELVSLEQNFQNIADQALIDKNIAKQDDNEIDYLKFKSIYEENIINQKEVFNDILDQKSKVEKVEIQYSLSFNRIVSIELQRLLYETNKQLKVATDINELEKLNEKILDIESKIPSFMEKSLNINNQNGNQKSAVSSRMKDKGTSVGYRVYMHKLVLDFISKNPLTGSSFLGVWTLFEDGVGSAHSQYLDVLFRVGIVAFIIYLFFIIKIALFLLKNEIGLFFGFIGLLFFGFFHETIKLSQGGFVFAFLFAMWAQQKRLF